MEKWGGAKQENDERVEVLMDYIMKLYTRDKSNRKISRIN